MKRIADFYVKEDVTKKSKWDTFGPSFRRILNTETAINALNDFVKNSSEKDVVSEYINAGGSAAEIVKLLKQFGGAKDFIVANTVFSALRIIILKTLDDLLLIQESVEEACEELLCSYLSTMQSMLGSDVANSSYKKTVLQLLTGMVTLSDGLAKKILTLFSMNPKLLRNLTDARSTAARKLRTCFIHYLISFLVSDNSVLITELLSKKGLLISIIPGLINDEPSIVVLVLNTLRTKIVENTRISKTVKIRTFNTHVLVSISKLYDCKMVLNVDGSEPEVVVQSIRESAHALLLLLCTSSKKGILFRDKHSTWSSSNQLLLSLLENIEKPWKDKLKSLLVTEILKVCPEFSKNVFERLESYLQPRVSTDWIHLMTFVKQIIEESVFVAEIVDKKQLLTAIVTSNFYPIIQKLLSYVSDEVHPDPLIRYHIIAVMEGILRKIKTILAVYEETLAQRDRIPQFLVEHMEPFLLKNLIPSRYLINAWNTGVDIVRFENVSRTEDDAHLSPPGANCYFDTLADLLLLSGTLCPTYFSHLRVDENIRLADVEINNPELQFKRAELIFRIYSPKPGEEQFRPMMKQFIECYSQNIRTVPDTVIKNVFLATGFFDRFEEEIFIWMYSIKKVGFQHSTVVSSLLIDTFCAVTRKKKKFLQDLAIVFRESDDASLKDIHLPQNLEYFFDLSEEFDHISKCSILLSPLVPAFLNVLKSYEKAGVENENFEIMKSFALHFLIHLLHLQGNVRGLLTIVNKYKNSFVDSCFYDYVNFWTCDKLKLKCFKFPLANDVSMSTWSQHIMRGDCVCQVSRMVVEASEIERILLWNISTFYMNQLEKDDSLETKIFNFVSSLKTIWKNLQLENAFSCLKSLLSTPSCIYSFFTGNGRVCTPLSCIIMGVCLDFTTHCVAIPSHYSTLISPYRLRFVLFLLNEMEHCRNLDISSFGCEIENVFQFIVLPNKTAVRLLNFFSHLPVRTLVDEGKKCFSGWTVIVQQLLKIVARNLQTPMEKESFLLLLNVLPQMLKLSIVPDGLEENLIDYLKSFPHHLEHISNDFVTNVITLHPKIDKLVLFLLPYFPENFPILQNKIMQNIQQLDLRTLLEVARTTKNQEAVLSVIYQNYFRELTSWCDGSECCWEVNDVGLVATIFRNIAERKTCLKLCKKVELNWLEMNLKIEKCTVIRAIFENAGKINHYIELLISKFKQMSEESTNWICSEIYDTVNILDADEFSINRVLLLEFIKMSFKNSLQTSDATLIRTVKSISLKLSSAAELDDVNVVFQMMIMHSQFVSIMLSDSSVKCELVELLLILTKKNKSLMSSNHLPILLGAYKATLSAVDQILLQVLQLYEENEIRFTHCRPYLWGDAAITHHNIRDEIRSLKQVSQPNQVLDLLDISIIKNTIKYFPLNRSLRPDKRVDAPLIEIYDPCFMLPLFSHLLASESRISVRKFTRSGALSLLLMALSSDEPIIRTASCHCLQRFSFHITSNDKEMQIWDHFLTALKNGISAGKNEVDIPPQLACIVATFLARMCLIISEPLHTLYAPLTSFLLAKPVFDVNAVPNFLILYYSSDMKFQEHQKWILKVIRDGMRGKMDFIISQKCYLFKLLPQFYSNAVSNETINTIILDIIANALQIRECRLQLLTKHGLMSWISQIVGHMPENCKHFLPPVIRIFKSALTRNPCNMIEALLFLFTKLVSRKVDHSIIKELISIFSYAYYVCKNEDLLDENDMELVITFAAPFLDVERKKQLQNCLSYKSMVGISKEGDDNLTKCIVQILDRFMKRSKIN